MWAAWFNELNPVACLLQSSHIPRWFINAQDNDGKTALEYAAQAGNGAIIASYLFIFCIYDGKRDTAMLLRAACQAQEYGDYMLAASLIYTLGNNLQTLEFF